MRYNLKDFVNNSKLVNGFLGVWSKLLCSSFQSVNIDHGQVVIVLVDLGYGPVEHPGHHLSRCFLLSSIERFAVLRVLQILPGKFTVVPVDDAHLPPVFRRQRPDGLSLEPPVLQVPGAVLLAEELPGVEVEHVVPDDPGVLGVEPSGHAGPDRQVVGREDGHDLLHGAPVLLDPVEGLQSVPGHVGHVPPAGGEVVPPQSTDDDDQQRSPPPGLVAFVTFVWSSVHTLVLIIIIFIIITIIIIITNRSVHHVVQIKHWGVFILIIIIIIIIFV